MKRFLKRTWPLLALIAIFASLGIFYGATLSRDDNLGITEEDLAFGAQIGGGGGSGMAFDGSALSAWSVVNRETEAVVTFPEPTEVNALLLNEIGYNVRKYSIQYFDGEAWNLCYRQNEIGINRLATFYTVKAEKLKVVIEDLKNTARIADIKIYKLEQRARTTPFRVTSYITPPSLNNYNPETGMAGNVDERCFDVVTDVQFIAYARFQADGTVKKEKDADNLAVLKQMIGARDVNIYLTVFPPLGASMADTFRNHMDTAIAGVVDTVLTAGADGADFDWEYPANADEYALYSDFLIKLGAELDIHGKTLSVALSPWGVQLSQDAIDAIDQAQVMAYDLFDHNGDNNSYAGSAESAVLFLLEKGFRPEQLNLGVSYYGRPNDASGKWYNFNDPSFTQDEYIMFERGVYFNTPTTVRDRTAYAILRGLGGVMTFAQDEDMPMVHPLSLTAQIGKAKSFFSKTEAR